jgi:hypothetical protein
MRYGEIEDSWENQKECKEEIVLHDFVILYNKKGGNKKVEEKLNLWGKIGRHYYTYGITSIRRYSKLIATV